VLGAVVTGDALERSVPTVARDVVHCRPEAGPRGPRVVLGGSAVTVLEARLLA
jgi:hypothetical protein